MASGNILSEKVRVHGVIMIALMVGGVVVAHSNRGEGQERSSATDARSSAANRAIDGIWQGTVHVPDANLRTSLRISRSPAGTLSATMYSLDQGGQPIVADSVTFQAGVLRFANHLIGISFEGKMSADGSSISGALQQGASFPMVFERASPETAWEIPVSPAKIPAMADDAKPGVEVATIKPTPPDAPRTVITFRGSEIVISRLTLNDLVEYAYNVQEKQILNGPGWMGADKFDINARPDQPGTPNGEQFRLVLQKLLADRFGLRFKNEQRTMSAYVLTTGKDGPKMTKSADPSGRPGFSEGPGGLLRIRNATMGDFANVMQSTVLDRPVVDRTGLKGRWDFVLKWRPDETQFGGQLKLPSTNDAADNLPPLFTAIQEQLDLKLEGKKTQVPVIIIDHVEPPSPN